MNISDEPTVDILALLLTHRGRDTHGRRFADDTFKRIVLNESARI